MLSKFASKIRINKDNYVILNNLLFSPILMNKIETKDLFNGNLTLFSDKEIETLYKKGILIENPSRDKAVEKVLKETINKLFSKQVGMIYIIPVDGCNLACKYCFIGKIGNVKSQVMNSNTIDNTIKKFTEHLEKNKNKDGSIVFYGGEPTLSMDVLKRAVDSIKKYSKNPIDIAIVTNATLFNDEILDFFKKSNISVGISIDGPRELTDKYRVFKNSDNSVYDSVIENIKKIKEKGIKFGLSITLSNDSLNNKNFLKWLKKLDVKNINFNLLHYTEKTEEWKEYYRKVSKFLFKAYDFLNENDIKDGRLLRKFKAFYGNKFKYNDCGAIGGEQLTIKPNGDVTVCHGYWNSDREICGNINKNTFDGLIKSETYQKWKNNLTINKSKCLKCPAIYICGGGCPKQSEALFGDQKKIDKSFCIHTKYSLKELLKRNFDL